MSSGVDDMPDPREYQSEGPRSPGEPSTYAPIFVGSAADAQHATPNGFTWEMVDIIREQAQRRRAEDRPPRPGSSFSPHTHSSFRRHATQSAALLDSIADLIAALLPPREAK